VKRIKLILATVAAMAVMMVAAVSPALADHGWWFSDWWELGDDSGWWCYTAWEHEEDGWDFEYIACWHPDHGWWIG
jgi:hypothetical protein